MDPLSLYLVMTQTPPTERSSRDGRVVRRRRRHRRPTAARSIV